MAKQRTRCTWAAREDMWSYHDLEWGVPIHDDQRHFEFLVLEGAQAGLSWSTILNKRDGYRRAFAGFDPAKVARFTPARVEKILLDPGIVRNRSKVECTVSNAKQFLALVEEVGSFDDYIWGFVDGKSQTRLPWDSWKKPYTGDEPPIWFHEVLRGDGTPYRKAEVDLIKRLTAAPKGVVPAK